jgi:peptidoglycan/xylan/chitin deacetylase (PgdA/CDA1 family)
MQALHSGGYQTITCAQMADYLSGVRDIPPKSVLLSFDDGRADFLTGAAPVLGKLGFKAVLFVITGSVGAKGNLSWEDLQGLMQAGHEIGSHTATHLNLTRLGKGQSLVQLQERVRREIETSGQTLEEKLGQPAVGLAYPYGNYDEFAMRVAREAGFRVAFSIDPGVVDRQSHPYRLPRKMVVKGSSLKTLQRLQETEALHLSEIQPPVGERVSGTAYRLTARVTDPDAVAGVQVEAGRQTKVTIDRETSQLTVTSTLRRGANLVRVFAPGPPRRECGWVVVCDP